MNKQFLTKYHDYTETRLEKVMRELYRGARCIEIPMNIEVWGKDTSSENNLNLSSIIFTKEDLPDTIIVNITINQLGATRYEVFYTLMFSLKLLQYVTNITKYEMGKVHYHLADFRKTL